MVDQQNAQVRTRTKPVDFSDPRQTERLPGSPVQHRLSDASLARHLAAVADLAWAERDIGLAEHLVDAAYHLASQT